MEQIGLCKQRRPRSDATENKGMKLIWGNAFSRSSSEKIRFLIKASIGVFTGIPILFMGISVVFRYFGKSRDSYIRILKLIDLIISAKRDAHAIVRKRYTRNCKLACASAHSDLDRSCSSVHCVLR